MSNGCVLPTLFLVCDLTVSRLFLLIFPITTIDAVKRTSTIEIHLVKEKRIQFSQIIRPNRFDWNLGFRSVTITMADTSSQSNNDKIAALTKEAENLKLKLEEERQKLNDVSCKRILLLVTLHSNAITAIICFHFTILCVFNCIISSVNGG